MRILWAGPFYSDAALREKKAPNLAASKWSRGLLNALVDNEIRVIDHCSEQRWPKGKVFWQDDDPKWFLDTFPCERVAYCNAWGIKEKWLEWTYARRTNRLFESWRPDVVLCYNSLHQHNVAVMREARHFGVKNVPIVLDGDDPRGDNWKKLLHDNRYADGVVFLSWWMYKNYPVQNMPLLHMDGGADGFKGILPSTTNDHPQTTKKYTLVHTGALDYWRGLDFMKEVVHQCKRTDVRFLFCGKCDKSKRWAEFGNDPRVEVMGLLPDGELDEICRNADVLLSVREPKVGDNAVNYPSKIPQYLSYGKPIVSTPVPSLSPEYSTVLEISGFTPKEFVDKIDGVLSWNDKERETKFYTIRSWFESHKSWRRQGERLVEFLEEVIKR